MDNKNEINIDAQELTVDWNKHQKSINKKKKRRKARIAVLIAAVLVLSFTTVAVNAFPYVTNVVIPKKRLGEAFKNTFKDIEGKLSVSKNERDSQADDSVKAFTGRINTTNDDVKVDDNIDLSDYTAFDFDLTVDTNTEVTELFIKGYDEEDNEKLKLNLSGNIDGIDISMYKPYEKSMSIRYCYTEYEQELRGCYRAIIALLGAKDTQLYLDNEEAIRIILREMISGVEYIINNCEITNYNVIEGEDVHNNDITSIEIVIKKDNLSMAVNNVIDSLYDKRELNSYITFISTYTGLSKLEIKQRISDLLSEMDDTYMTFYITEENKIAGIYCKALQPCLGLNIKLLLGYVNNINNNNEHIILSDVFAFNITIDSFLYAEEKWNEYVPEIQINNCCFDFSMKKNDNQFIIDKITFKSGVLTNLKIKYADKTYKDNRKTNLNLNCSALFW